MTRELRILTESGLTFFRDWINQGAPGEEPRWLLEDLTHSQHFPNLPWPDRSGFADKMEFGEFLVDYLNDADVALIYDDKHFWATLSLIWFPEIRSLGKTAGNVDRYIPSDNDRLFYRHLIRANWLLYRDHGENARFMLMTSKSSARPLSVGGELLEQITGRQGLIHRKKVIAAINTMFVDPDTKRPVSGATGGGPGTARRFGKVLRQLDLTIDPETLTSEELISMLPREFKRWQDRVLSGETKST